MTDLEKHEINITNAIRNGNIEDAINAFGAYTRILKGQIAELTEKYIQCVDKYDKATDKIIKLSVPKTCGECAHKITRHNIRGVPAYIICAKEVRDCAEGFGCIHFEAKDKR